VNVLKINENARKYWVLAAMGAVLGVVVLDETVVGVALPTINLEKKKKVDVSK